MARLFLIIDGYNLMHAMGLARRSYGPGDLERCRNRLIQRVTSALDRPVAADSVIVFDATAAAPRDPPQAHQTPLQVIYSKDGRDADAEIELMLSCHSSPKQVLIISSDHRLHKAARRRKARCMDSEDFCVQLETSHDGSIRKSPSARPLAPSSTREKQHQPKKHHPTPPLSEPKPSTTSESEADYAQDFLKIDIDEIKRAVRKERP
jgi:uncharacterized protein